MKNRVLMTVLFLCAFLALTSVPAFAYIISPIDANYHWYTSGGTKCIETGQTWGDVSGIPFFKVQELWVPRELRLNATDHPGMGMFKYDIHALNETPLYDFKVQNVLSYIAPTRPPTVNNITWTEAHSSAYWYWSTIDANAAIDGDQDYIRIFTNAPRGYVRGSVSTYDGRQHPTYAQGMLSGPVPEPSSMLLLGMGILGLFGLGRKKIKA